MNIIKKVSLLIAVVFFFSTITPSFAIASTLNFTKTEEITIDGNNVKFVTEKNDKHTIITVYEGEEINIVKMDNNTKNFYLNDELIPQETISFIIGQAELEDTKSSNNSLDLKTLNPELSIISPLAIDPGPNTGYIFQFHSTGYIDLFALTAGAIAAIIGAYFNILAGLILGAGIATAVAGAVSIDRAKIRYTHTKYKHDTRYMDFLSYFSFYSANNYGEHNNFIGNFTVYH